MGQEWEVSANGFGVSFRDVENILKLIMVMTSLPCVYAKSHCIAHLRWVNLMVCEL